VLRIAGPSRFRAGALRSSSAFAPGSFGQALGDSLPFVGDHGFGAEVWEVVSEALGDGA